MSHRANSQNTSALCRAVVLFPRNRRGGVLVHLLGPPLRSEKCKFNKQCPLRASSGRIARSRRGEAIRAPFLHTVMGSELTHLPPHAEVHGGATQVCRNDYVLPWSTAASAGDPWRLHATSHHYGSLDLDEEKRSAGSYHTCTIRTFRISGYRTLSI